jgi:hypothetical protein
MGHYIGNLGMSHAICVHNANDLILETAGRPWRKNKKEIEGKGEKPKNFCAGRVINPHCAYLPEMGFVLPLFYGFFLRTD